MKTFLCNKILKLFNILEDSQKCLTKSQPQSLATELLLRKKNVYATIREIKFPRNFSKTSIREIRFPRNIPFFPSAKLDSREIFFLQGNSGVAMTLFNLLYSNGVIDPRSNISSNSTVSS